MGITPEQIHESLGSASTSPWDLAWTLDPEPFGIPLYSYSRYLRVNP